MVAFGVCVVLFNGFPHTRKIEHTVHTFLNVTSLYAKVYNITNKIRRTTDKVGGCKTWKT